jgi:hypothetical protein
MKGRLNPQLKEIKFYKFHFSISKSENEHKYGIRDSTFIN